MNSEATTGPDQLREEVELRLVERSATERSWIVPAHADKGPITVSMRAPEVRIVDSAGRHIVVGPEQADLLGSKLCSIRDWLQMGDADWMDGED
jgi:hypothetical protein